MNDYSTFQAYEERFETVTNATIAVAVFRQDPLALETIAGINFRRGYNDLDYLRFAIIELPVGEVALVYHERSPKPGTSLCVSPSNQDIPRTICEVVEFLKINPQEDISWIHPDYADKASIVSAVCIQ
jgi:hypothetical protein